MEAKLLDDHNIKTEKKVHISQIFSMEGKLIDDQNKKTEKKYRFQRSFLQNANYLMIIKNKKRLASIGKLTRISIYLGQI
jgi:ribosomal protein L24